MTKLSHPSRLLVALMNGAQLTSKQISARFGARNPRDAVHVLRREGFDIDLITSKNSKGQVRRKYSMAV